MNRYTIYCTEEQTKKALELGAPILNRKNAITRDDIAHFTEGEVMKDWKLFFCPTAEQMIGWLEERISFIDVIKQENNTWLYIIYPDDKSNKNVTVKGFSARSEATLAAIDAALEYLENLKQ